MTVSPGQKAAGGVAAILAACAVAVPLIANWEGVEEVGYRDPVGIVTTCAGHTRTAVLGKRYTLRQCMDLLAADTVSHAVDISHCISVEVPPESYAAFISFSYNVGAEKFCRSTMARKLNAGDLAGACAELSRWIKARKPNGELIVLKGLVNRRAEERAYCERGLAAESGR